MDYKKISVLIVTYKQQDVIGRNIDSILQQKEFGLNEIVICDDCSPDNNWGVIQEYVAKFPKIIRAYRNETNLGIYGNSNKLMSLRGDSDFYCWLEGDDALCDGFFKAAQEFFNDRNLDTKEALGVFSGYKSSSLVGEEISYQNNYFEKYPKRNPFGAYSRGYVSWRSGLFTEKVLQRFEPALLEQGLSLAEFLFDSQWFIHIDKAFYMPFISSIYYTGIGVSTSLDETEYRRSEAEKQWQYYIDNMAKNFFDMMWGKSKIIRAKYRMNKPKSIFGRMNCILKYIYTSYLGMLPYGVNISRIKSGVYVMIR